MAVFQTRNALRGDQVPLDDDVAPALGSAPRDLRVPADVFEPRLAWALDVSSAEEAERRAAAARERFERRHGSAVEAFSAAARAAYDLVPAEPLGTGSLSREDFAAFYPPLVARLPGMALALRLPEMVAVGPTALAPAGLAVFADAQVQTECAAVVALTAAARAAAAEQALAAGIAPDAVEAHGAADVGQTLLALIVYEGAVPAGGDPAATAGWQGDQPRIARALAAAEAYPPLIDAARRLSHVGVQAAGRATREDVAAILQAALAEGPWRED